LRSEATRSNAYDQLMRWIWLAIVLVTAAPVVLLSAVMNPFMILVLGVEWWQDWLRRLNPYRWQLAFSTLVFVFSLAVYASRYT
jgi:hypothetical protein